MIILWIILGWVACGVITAGTHLAYFSDKFPTVANYRQDLAGALGFGLLFGPFGVIVSAFCSGFYEYGWRLTPRKEPA